MSTVLPAKPHLPHARRISPAQKAKEESDNAKAAAKAAAKAKATQEQLDWLARQVEDREEQKARLQLRHGRPPPRPWPRDRSPCLGFIYPCADMTLAGVAVRPLSSRRRPACARCAPTRRRW